ncbi:metallophosphoesterase family protein [Nannocystis punicea]|uniref:Metallophosphoesterase n=1 Tax=Nannocystis punicea TaxID=2995304 RepID=A0ABY7GUA0_9BACT|nr:metallophosphoesterase [Nannocystis poenicansa]WAS90540.1 metallophosphoesterase [Nannocystis poenicansa]
MIREDAPDSNRSATAPDTGQASPISWLHLSDLHVGARSEAAWWNALDKFWCSLDEHLTIVGPPDLVLLTGDLTFKGEPAEFDKLTKFLEKLLGRLPKAADGHPPLTVAVPGNHEVQRPTGREALLYRVLRDFEKGRDDPDVADLLEAFWDERDASFLRPLFANYLAWFDGVIRPQAARPGVTLRTSFFPGDVYAKLALPGRFPLSIVGLNSAWMQYQGGDFKGKLALPLEQFQAALPHAQGESPLGVLDATHRALLLMHHSRSWLSKPQRQLFDSGIYPGGRFVACLHGHMHEPDANNRSEAGGVARCYYQAPSLFGVEKYGSAEESRAIGYTWATLRDDGELRAWPLKLKRKSDGAEVFDRDDFFHWDPAAGNVLLRPGDGQRLVGSDERSPARLRPQTQVRQTVDVVAAGEGDTGFLGVPFESARSITRSAPVEQVYLNVWFPKFEPRAPRFVVDLPIEMRVALGPQRHGAPADPLSEDLLDRLRQLSQIDVWVQCADADVTPCDGTLQLPWPTNVLSFELTPRRPGGLRIVVVLLIHNQPVHRLEREVQVHDRRDRGER